MSENVAVIDIAIANLQFLYAGLICDASQLKRYVIDLLILFGVINATYTHFPAKLRL
jgi:hypothetical protein